MTLAWFTKCNENIYRNWELLFPPDLSVCSLRRITRTQHYKYYITDQATILKTILENSNIVNTLSAIRLLMFTSFPAPENDRASPPVLH